MNGILGNINNIDASNNNSTAVITGNSSSKILSKKEEHSILLQFIENTASQLTYYGLIRLHQQIREESLSILFRNNHFNVIYKMKDKLFVLVTDEGFCNVQSSDSNQGDNVIVWELLQDIHGYVMCISIYND